MLSALATQLALVLGVLATFFVGPGTAIVFLIIRKKRGSSRRRSPLGIDLLRTPGHTVRAQLDEATSDLTWDLLLLTALPLMMLSLYLLQKRFVDAETGHSELIYGVLAIASITSIIRKMLKAGKRIDNLRAGFDAELAVGQELDQLMRQGAVVFDGHVLRFPTWATSKPLEQAERQARWLSKWATSAVGDTVAVTPVLALPGWFVQRTGKSAVKVFSGKALASLL